jgi:hypothetical protein
MPSANRFIINLRGTPDYERYLGRVVRAAIKAGMPIEPGEFNKLAELALYELGERLKVNPVERIPPHGKAKPKPKPSPTP